MLDPQGLPRRYTSRQTYLVITEILTAHFRGMLHLTSLLFGTNAAHAFIRNKLFYAGLFILLMITSVAWHSSPKLEPEFMPIFWLDQAAIAAVLVMSGYYVSRMKSNQWILIGLLGAIAALTWYLGALCSWERSYPVEHGTLHALVSATFHTIVYSF